MLDTDASTWGIGAVLSQRQPNEKGELEERPIAYASRLLLPRELNYCTRKRELLAIYEWVQYFQHYLAGEKFEVRTDHDSLKGVSNLAKLPGQFARWLEYLNNFSFEIKVRAGVEHANADFVSRLFGDCFCKTREIFEQTESARDALRSEPIRDWDMFEKCAREVAARRVRYPRTDIIKIADAAALKNVSESDLKDQMEVACKMPVGAREDTFNKLREEVRRARKADTSLVEITKPRPQLNVHTRPRSTMVLQPYWTKEELKTAQTEDPDFKLLYKHKSEGLGKPDQTQISGLSAAGKAYMRDWSLIELKNELLYRYYEDATRSQAYYRLMIPHAFQQRIIEKSHEHGLACHQGYRRALANIKLRYDWHDMRNQIRVYTRACAVCQRKRSKNINTRSSMVGHLPGYKGERVNMDVCGPFVVTPLKNKYLLVICDSFTKYVVAAPVTDTRATTLADAFLQNWCNVFGYPTEIHTDRGTYFTSELWRDMCLRLNMRHTLGSALRPQSNGQNERQIRAVQESLRVALNGHRKNDWDVRASYATAAYNFTPHSVTQFAPHELMFGELPQMEIDFLMPSKEQTRQSQGEYLEDLLTRMRLTYIKVRENLQRAMEIRKERHDKGVRTIQYKLGQAVALKLTNKLVGNDKLADKYDGPYYIVSVWDNGVVRIQLKKNSAPKLIHFDRIEPWVEKDGEEAPAWVKDSIKKFAPARQEVGVQVSFDLLEGEIVGVRSSPALLGSFATAPSLAPTRPLDTGVIICRVCDEPKINEYGVMRSFSRNAVCHICVGTPEWHFRSQGERCHMDKQFQNKRWAVRRTCDIEI